MVRGVGVFEGNRQSKVNVSNRALLIEYQCGCGWNVIWVIGGSELFHTVVFEHPGPNVTIGSLGTLGVQM